MAITSMLKIALVLHDALYAIDAVRDVIERPQEEDSSLLLEAANVVNALAKLGFSLLEIGLHVKGSKPQTMVQLKNTESVFLSLGMPIKMIKVMDKVLHQNQGEWESVLSVLQKGVAAPLADIVRVSAEASAYQEQLYLKMTPEERATAKRPVYEYNPSTDAMEHVGDTPIDIEECKANLEAAQKIITKSSIVRLGAEHLVATRAIQAVGVMYHGLKDFYSRFHLQGRQLQNLPLIPPPLFPDPILQTFTCPILQQPIRHPVGDPTNRRTDGRFRTIYERHAIETWVQHHPVSPVTRLPLTVNQLVPLPAVEAMIVSRLQLHDQNFQDYLLQTEAFDQRLHAPAAQNLQNAVNAEFQ